MIERRYQVVEMRRDGYTILEIAKSLGVTVETIRKDLTQVLNATIEKTAETTEENRQLQIERLDKLLKEYMYLATSRFTKVLNPTTGVVEDKFVIGSLAAAQMVLGIEMRRAKLLALDVPETRKLEVSGIREYVGVDTEQV
jgi:hypothetical protein